MFRSARLHMENLANQLTNRHNINIDSDPKGIEILKPLLFGKNLDRHTYRKS